jgi:hypothetical protein
MNMEHKDDIVKLLEEFKVFSARFFRGELDITEEEYMRLKSELIDNCRALL